MKKTRLTPHLALCMMGFSYIASFSVVTPILSIYVKDVVNAPIETVGLVTAMFFLASALAKISLGVFAGGKTTITSLFFAFVVLFICPALYPLTNSVVLLIILRSVHGFAYSFIATASLILAAIAVSIAERDRGVGAYTASLSLGLLSGPVTTVFSIPLFGISTTFYFAGLMGIIGVFAAFFLKKKVSSIEEDWQIIGVTVDEESLRGKFSALMRNRMFIIAFAGSIAFFALFGVILAYAPLYAKEKLAFSDELVSVLFLLYYVATTVTRFSIGKVVRSKRLSKSALMILCTMLATLFSFSLAIFENNLAFGAIVASIGAVQGILFPLSSMLIADSIQPSRNILANSLYMMGIDIGQGVAPLVTATVIAQYGLEYSFIVSTATLATVTLLLIWLHIH